MIISPFNSIFFIGHRKCSGIASRYIQTFASTDRVLIQIIRASGEQQRPVVVVDEATGVTAKTLVMGTKAMSNGSYVDYCYMEDLADGLYHINVDDLDSIPFRVTSDSKILDSTVLIKYCVGNNLRRTDVLGILNSAPLYFSFRVPGGFVDDGVSFTVDNEQFITAEADIVELYSLENYQKKLMVGYSYGVPIWFGALLNKLLTCQYVYIDGVRHVRFESSVPQKEQVLIGHNSFVFSQMLQEVLYNKHFIDDYL
ncbi:hypothetical protein IMSAGC008_01613 [Muribaculaceae bacterium]|jgi:hypothetical protein|nr:hypothetical protein IMSAGC008_01613 [Muribaculaceae bacterium]